ncbi:bifunctional helix-turn-helix transcriptional regulator/alpha/beta hydrolase [Roseovarius sp.]|jgi:DNA-binding CsgD family transcriptional regulator/pimeloyl-ACP methyl ester carboxylesterase
MTIGEQDDPAAEQDLILDRIYGIALEPSSLDDFIELWHDMDLARAFVDNSGAATEAFGAPYRQHLERAQEILQREEVAHPDLMEFLEPYENLAAFVVGGSLRIAACNPGARAAFSARPGSGLDQLVLPAELRRALSRTTQEVLRGTDSYDKILKTDMASKGSTILFRITRIARLAEDSPNALIVSSQFHWSSEIGALLAEVYQLTAAEQDVVRFLVEGQETKSIAQARGTSEGTVRNQIKSITGKMHLRSQTDIVRFAMALSEFPKGTVGKKETVILAAPATSRDWLDAEVWKPFRSLSLSDGRTLSYHDMGPVTGNPAILTHTGSCMVRWPRSMIHLAFEMNLRVICPIRAGYGSSDDLELTMHPVAAASTDTAFLLKHLDIQRLPYVAQGTDFPFAIDLVAKRPDLVTEVLGFGARPCLPGGLQANGVGRWQRFFVSTARDAPHLAQFASRAVMAMSRKIGPEAMLRTLCKHSPADLALLDNEEMKQVLVANISLMSGKSTNAARAFAMEYIAFQEDWTDLVRATQQIPVQLFLAEEDPTIDLGAIPAFQNAYPWIGFEVVNGAGLALTFQKAEKLIPLIAEAAKRAI